MPSYLEFFAGGGMVRAGLGGRWKCQFANDFDPLKVQVYTDNWGEKEILESDIHRVKADDLGRRADLGVGVVPLPRSVHGGQRARHRPGGSGPIGRDPGLSGRSST